MLVGGVVVGQEAVGLFGGLADAIIWTLVGGVLSCSRYGALYIEPLAPREL